MKTYCMVALALIAHFPARAATQTFECPSAIPEKSIQLDPKQGWRYFVGLPLYLHAAAPMNGPPDQLGELADFTQQRGKNGWTYAYQLDGKFPNGKWLTCMYGEHDQITLAKRIPDRMQSCVFVYREGQYAGQNDIKIQCR
jgi:hypothetical protein